MTCFLISKSRAGEPEPQVFSTFGAGPAKNTGAGAGTAKIMRLLYQLLGEKNRRKMLIYYFS